jgi:hypothetical protein
LGFNFFSIFKTQFGVERLQNKSQGAYREGVTYLCVVHMSKIFRAAVVATVNGQLGASV